MSYFTLALADTLTSIFDVSPGEALENNSSLGIYWKSFRTLHPLQRQEVVVASRPDPSGHRYVLISDPPPHVLTPALGSDLEGIFGDALAGYEIFKNEIGVDGWVKDIGIELDNAKGDQEALEGKFLALFRWLYKTDYKAYLTFFDAKSWLDDLSPRRGLGPPDMRVSAASLNAWFFVDKLPVVHLSTGRQSELREILEKGTHGFYRSEPAGLIIAELPRDQDIQQDQYYTILRQFALDTDAILGAIAWGPPSNKKSALAIVGRARDTSLTDVPPLRVETILTLAASGEDELAQSYERRTPFAGKGKDVKDWAPIYLSRDLTNTEFGNLLNVTD